VTADRVLVETEVEVSTNDVPPGVRKAAKKLSKGQAVGIARCEFIDYEIGYIQDGQAREVMLSSTDQKLGTDISFQAGFKPDDVD